MHNSAFQMAQQWHDEHTVPGSAHYWSSCWCCCTECDPSWLPPEPNPHYDAAVNEQRAARLSAD